MNRRLTLVLTGVCVLGSTATAAAHGIGARGDLPIPREAFLAASALAVILSFFLAATMWREPRLAAAAAGRRLPSWTASLGRAGGVLGRTAGLLGFVVVLIAAWGGMRDATFNIAPVTVYVVVWVILLWACALVGNIWAALNPWDTLAMYAGGRLGPPPQPPADVGRLALSHWPAALSLLGFQWLELAHPDPADPRVVAIALSVYTALVLIAAARWGRVWIQTGEGFTVLFTLVAAMAPFGRDAERRPVLRWPFTGLARVPARRGLAAVVVTVIGGTTFDGLSRSRWYADAVGDVAGWQRAGVNTVGLLAAVGAVGAAYVAAVWMARRLGGAGRGGIVNRYAVGLVPIALAYSVAHYFSLAVFEGQSAWRLLSDPYGQGWDLFGTAGGGIDYGVVGTTAIALVQTGAIVVGHVAAVMVAHDLALDDVGPRRAALAQLPMLVLMVGLTVTGLTLLLSA